jgi:hypothetical protein
MRKVRNARRCWRVPALLVLGMLVVGAGCSESPVAIRDELFTLHTVNGAALPAEFATSSGPPVVEITAGSLRLSPNGDAVETLTLRCMASLPAGTTCEVPGNGQLTRTGTFSQSEQWIRLDGTQHPFTLSGNVATVTLGAPPSQGFVSPRYELEYRR